MGVFQNSFNQMLTMGAAAAAISEKSDTNQKILDTDNAAYQLEVEQGILEKERDVASQNRTAFEEKYGTDPELMNEEQSKQYQALVLAHRKLNADMYMKGMQMYALRERRDILQARNKGGIIGESLARNRFLYEHRSGQTQKKFEEEFYGGKK